MTRTLQHEGRPATSFGDSTYGPNRRRAMFKVLGPVLSICPARARPSDKR